MNPSVDFCVVTYNNADTIEDCVRSILEHAPASGIRVLDNSPGSTTMAELERLAVGNPRISVTSAQGNLGFGRACNQLATESTAEWVVFLNPDARLDRFSLDLGGYIGADVVGAEVFSPEGTLDATAGPERDLGRELGLRWFRRLDRVPGGKAVGVGFVSGAALAMRRPAFLELGGFDSDRYFMYYEDIDLCMAARRAGGQIWRDPSWRVTHLGGHSARRDHLTALKRSHESARNYHDKWERGAVPFTALSLVEAAIKSSIALVMGRVGSTTRRTQLALTAYLFRRLLAELSGAARRRDANGMTRPAQATAEADPPDQ